MIDSHAHLTDERFAGEVEGVLERAREAGVEAVVSIATEPETARAALALAKRFENVYATAGIHPHSVGEATEESYAVVRELLGHPRVVAVGEVGMDFHYDFAPASVQREALLRQMEIARELDLPLIVHAREADEELTAILREAGPGTRGVLHSFSSGRELLETALGLGWYASFSGMVTFKSYDGDELLRSVPIDRIMVETDSPYLAPVPNRGKRNEPAFVPFVARRVAELRGLTVEEVDAVTTENTRRFFRLDD